MLENIETIHHSKKQYQSTEISDVNEFLLNKLNEENKEFINLICGENVTQAHLEQMHRLSSETFNTPLVTPLNKLIEFHAINPFIYWILADMQNNIIGFKTAYPVTEKCYQKILSPEFNEIDIQNNDLATYQNTNNFNIFFSSIVIHSNYKFKCLANTIELFFLNDMIEHSQNGKNITSFSAEIVSEGGRKMAERLGMSFKCNTFRDTQVYNSQVNLSKLLEIHTQFANDIKFLL